MLPSDPLDPSPGDRHAVALRNLFNRFLGQLHHCLTTGQHYTEVEAFPARL